MSSFVDLFMAANARCFVLGVGRFADLAAMISGTKCWTTHETTGFKVQLKWGIRGIFKIVPECPIPEIGSSSSLAGRSDEEKPVDDAS
jgi:hypothetical protein